MSDDSHGGRMPGDNDSPLEDGLPHEGDLEHNYAAEDDDLELNDDAVLHQDVFVVECVGEDQVNDFPDTLAKMAMDATVPTTETWILVYLDEAEAQQAAEYIGGNLSVGRIVETVPDGVNNYVYLESGNVLVFEVA